MNEDNPRPPSVYTPANEPYLGRSALHQLDITIIGALKANRAVADTSRAGALTDLQRAACEIIPQGVSIGLSIRELIRQGYLFSAFVLLRPLIERAAIISYLVRNPESVENWKNGWKHGERPSLRKMLDAMGWSQVDTSMAKQICEFFSHAVHGDPCASYWNRIHLQDGDIGYASGRILNRPDFCDIIAASTFPYFIILMAMMAACFPSVAEVPEAITDTVGRLFPTEQARDQN
jgi:hypothetical protein